MNVREMFVGALFLHNETFTNLRAQSDVFWRGFLVLFIAAVVAGFFGATTTFAASLIPPPPKDVVMRSVQIAFEQQFGSLPQIAPILRPYLEEGTSLGYELSQLPPRVGAWATPFVNLFNTIGTALVTPSSFSYIGWTLLAGLLFGASSRWFGGKGELNQVLGLTALAAAPQIFNAVPALLATIATLTGITALTSLNGIIFLVTTLWSAAIYVKGLSVAQDFSIGRSVGAIIAGFAAIAAILIFFVLLIAWAIGRVL